MPSFSRAPLSAFVVLLVAACGQESGDGAGSGGGGGAAEAGTPASAGGSSAGGGQALGGATGSNAGAGAGGATAGATAGGAPLAGAGGGGAKQVGVFVAQGHEGRITRSCDDGVTFPFNESADDTYRCFVDEQHNCDHSPLAGRGLASGKGSFVATWGWGAPGKLQRSLDGRQFSDVMTDTPTFADIAFGNDTFVAGGNPTWTSKDGASWEMGGKLSFDFNYRGIEFVPADGGTFVVTGESTGQRAISISHDGKSWTAASTRPEPCGEELRGVAGSDSVIVLASSQGHVCRSVDGGKVWTHHPVTSRFTSPPLWTGDEFWLYEGDRRWKSVDGEKWSSEALSPPGVAIGPLARSPEGTLVAANDGWQVWYEKQQLYRSTDGLTWELLPGASFTGSHPIYFVSFGYVAATSGCGAP